MGWKITFDATRRHISDEDRAVELAADPYVSVWEDGTGKVVDFDDLSPEFFDKIARDEKDADVNWWTIYRFPGGQAARMHKVMTAAAEFAGVEVPAKPSTMREVRLLMEQFEPTEDPTVASETERASSSGPSDVSAGLPASSDENGSATS